MANPPSGPAPDLAIRVAEQLGLQTDLAKIVLADVLTNIQLLDKKQQDYGPLNLTKFGPFGIVVRMNDKMERIVNLIKKERAAQQRGASHTHPNHEAITDSFLDLANYSMIGYVMQSGTWPVNQTKKNFVTESVS